jgi:hypothetical protein
MKFFCLGSSLALLMAGVACTQSNQTATSPSATSPIVAAATAAADGSTIKVSPPGIVSPVDGVRAEDRRPTLIWTNAEGKYAGIGLAYDIELSTPEKVVYETTVGESPDFGAHAVPFDLDFDVMYSWRARPRGRSLWPVVELGDVPGAGPAEVGRWRRWQCRHWWLCGAVVADGPGRIASAASERFGNGSRRRIRIPRGAPALMPA